MEADRFKINSKLYILGMICLVLCLSLFFFSLYLVPYLIWTLNYHVPLFVLSLLASLQEDYNYTAGASKLLVWLLFFVPSVLTGIISDYVSNRIDNTIYEPPTDEHQHNSPEDREEMKESAGLVLKILGLMGVIILIIFLLQFFIQSQS